MGNLSNPSINRWGLNLLWYKNWYNDKIRQSVIHQDLIFEKLIYFYLYFGYEHKFNIFKHTFWYKQEFFTKAEQEQFNLKYIRQFEFFDKFTNEQVQVILRNRTKDFFASKMWMLRYQNWILINFYTFQPIKKKKTTKKINIANFSTISVENRSQNISYYRRLKLLFFFVQLSDRFFYYKF